MERELGGGGMSRVYLAEETALGRRVVIKTLPSELARAVASERFRREIRLAARLTHPHIVPLLSAGESEGVPWYTMPYLEGTTLRGRLSQGPMSIAEAVSLLRDVARALVYAHEHGVVHRDIKPENVLLTGGMGMVTDFGIAKALTAATGESQSGLTSLGVVMGTPAYMAPEQGVGDPAMDHRADIYAFGCLAYEALTGAPPFTAGTAIALIGAHAIDKPEPVSRRRPETPPALAELVMRCLAKRPADRPQSAAELLQALEDVPTRPFARRQPRLALLAGVLAILLGLAVVFLPGRRDPPAATRPGPFNSVAVLPFVNTGGDPEDEYFSDGMTDELAHALAGLPDIRVAGRTSSYAYKGKPVRVQEIGRSLGVQGVIAGTVRRAGDRLRVTVQLSSAADGFQRWSHEYERRSTDVFELQDELTQAIVAELEPALRGSATGVASERRGTTDPEAYEHYLRGRYFWLRRGTPALLKSLDEYRAAIARDSGFARAWAGTAMTYAVLPSYAPMDTDSITALSVAAARRALALDSSLVEGHLALANALANEMRLEDAEAEYRRVIALAPNNPTVHQWYASCLLGMGRVEEALAASRRAVALDPLSAVIVNDQASVLLSARRYDDAFVAARLALELDSTFTYTRVVLAWLHGVTGHPDSALAQLGLDPSNDPGPTWRGSGWKGVAAWAYGIAGRRADAERMRAEIAREPGGPSPYDEAMAALALGDLEGTVRGLARSLERHELLGLDPSPACTPVFDPLSRLDSFRSLMARYAIRVCQR
ncbi:MAG TPA: protein kinase [Gemmatimonadales bacterium]|nr:protein kinase [Gemmatimonadales bacterium]